MTVNMDDRDPTSSTSGSAPDNTDIAALGGSVVAIAMTIFGDEGPYDLFGVAISITLLLLVAGYALPYERKGVKRWGVAAVIGLVFAPITGYLMEQQAGRWTYCDAWNDNRVSILAQPPARGFHAADACGAPAAVDKAVERLKQGSMPREPRSTVRDEATLFWWGLFASLFLAGDIGWASYRRRRDDRKAAQEMHRLRSASAVEGGQDDPQRTTGH